MVVRGQAFISFNLSLNYYVADRAAIIYIMPMQERPSTQTNIMIIACPPKAGRYVTHLASKVSSPDLLELTPRPLRP